MDPRYSQRTVYWGHWDITFMDVQPDTSKNFGIIVASLPFGIGNCGPCDGTIGSPLRKSLKQACRTWIEKGELPERAIKREAT